MENNLLLAYIKALVNLNGIIYVDKVIEIFNMQNNEKIDLFDIGKSVTDFDLEQAFIYTYEDYFIHEVIDSDEFYALKIQKKGKPYYIPKKAELLKYEDDFYFEKTPEYNKLRAFIRKKLIQDDEIAEYIADDIRDICEDGFDLSRIMFEVNNRDVSFESENQVQEFLKLVMDVSNNVRLWENNGHTPNEIYNLVEKQAMKPLPKKKFSVAMKDEGKRETACDNVKVGRNDACSCGSGKKYKKCCGKN